MRVAGVQSGCCGRAAQDDAVGGVRRMGPSTVQAAFKLPFGQRYCAGHVGLSVPLDAGCDVALARVANGCGSGSADS